MKKFLMLFLALAVALCGAASAEDVEPEDGEYAPEEEIVVEELIDVEDYALAQGLSDEWWNILLLGTDNRDSGSYGRTDSMIILSINPATEQAKMTSLMRDTWVSMYGRKSKAKLNAACVYGGPELTIRTVNECFGMNISDYVLVNITGLADIIDTLGGVDLAVTEAERKALNKGLFDLSSQSGMEKLEASGDSVHLNGNQAVAFSRIRKIDSDYRRTERQREVLTAMASKLQENDGLSIVGVVNSLLPYVETNLDFAELMSLSYIGLNMDLAGVEELRLPADGTFESGMYGNTWSIRPDFEKNQALLKEFIYGE